MEQLRRFVEVVSAAAAPVPVYPVVVPDGGDGGPQLPAVTWARDGGTTQPLMDGELVGRPAVVLSVLHPRFMEGEELREKIRRALSDGGLLETEPDPPSDEYIVDLVTSGGESGRGCFAITMTLMLGAL